MIRLNLVPVSLAAVSLLGSMTLAAAARADDVSIDFGVGFHEGRAPRGYVGVDVRADRPARVIHPAPHRPEPLPVVDPAPFRADRGVHRDAFRPRREFIPAHIDLRHETVVVPAIYEDRVVPVFEERHVPVFDQRRVAIYGWVVDARTGHRRHVVVGERLERVKIGERHEQVQVGTRIEHVLVRAETTRVVTREEWVPGRYVMVHRSGRHHDGHHGGRFDDGRFADHGVREHAGTAEAGVSEEEYARLVRAAASAPRGGGRR